MYSDNSGQICSDYKHLEETRLGEKPGPDNLPFIRLAGYCAVTEISISLGNGMEME